MEAYKVRCSSLGDVMTNDRSGKVMGETSKEAARGLFIANQFGRRKELVNKFVDKGLKVEEDSITLYSLITKQFNKKNTLRMENDFITGTPDFIDLKNNVVIDVKSSYDIFTYFKAMDAPLNKKYEWQLQGYMWLTGCREARLAYCLIDTPQALIADELRRLQYRMGVIDPDMSPEYQEAAKAIENNLTYPDIPNKIRMFEHILFYDEAKIEAIQARVLEVRELLEDMRVNLFDE